MPFQYGQYGTICVYVRTSKNRRQGGAHVRVNE